MSELNKKQKEELGRLYYVVNGLSAKEAADKVRVSENTFGKWVEKFGWKSTKAAEIGKAANLITALEDDILRIHQQAKDESRPINAQEADSIYKTSLTIRNLSKDFGIDVYNAVIQEFFNNAKLSDAEFVRKGVDYFDNFLMMKIKQRGN